MPFLHVYHVQDRQFMLFNEEGKLVTDEEIQFFMQTWGNDSISYEDIIVSTLITINPETFTLHTDMPNHTVIQTIKSIFEERVNLCTHCPDCVEWKNEKALIQKQY